MITREILIANTKDQSRYKAVTDASTLGQLKTVLTNPTLYEVYKQSGNDWVRHTTPISIDGMDFSEGITKANYVDNDALLPELVPFKGNTVSPVFLLTNTRKQIASGAMDRREAIRLVKEMGLADTIKEGEGDNFTRVKTCVLETYIYAALRNEEANCKESETNELPDVKEAPHASTVDWLYGGIKAMVKDSMLNDKDVVVLATLITEYAKRLLEEKPVITNDDIDNMIAAL